MAQRSRNQSPRPRLPFDGENRTLADLAGKRPVNGALGLLPKPTPSGNGRGRKVVLPEDRQIRGAVGWMLMSQ